MRHCQSVSLAENFNCKVEESFAEDDDFSELENANKSFAEIMFGDDNNDPY